MEEKLRLERDMRLSTVLALELADQVVEQEGKLETLLCSFVKLGRRNLPWIKVQALVTKPDWDAKRWNPWESEESEEEDVVIESKTDKTSRAIKPLINTKENKSK